MRALTLAEYKALEPTLRRPFTDRPPERLKSTITPVVAPSLADQERHRQRQRERPNKRAEHVEAEQARLGFWWDLSFVRPWLADARATARAMRGLL